MRARHLTSTAALLLVAAALPLRTDGANTAGCCNAAGSLRDSTVAQGIGDEGFFSIPIGPPNVMILLDNSGSMTDFPIPVVYPTSWPASRGTCTGQPLNAYTAAKSATPYDNGFSVGGLVDSPPWGLASCAARNSCLFRPTSYYRYLDWDTSTATEYDGGSTSTGACYRATNAAECLSCLDGAGFYLYRDTTGRNRASFKGDFLNGHPPKHVIARKVVKNLLAIDPVNPSPIDSVRFGLTVFAPNACNTPLGAQLAAGDGGQLVVPLGPSCDKAYPVTTSEFTTARQAIINALNNAALVPFGTCTPLAEALFNVGQYFTDMGQGSYYANHFTAAWTRASFDENAAGTINASWATGNRSFCWACQQSSVIIVTDGAPNWDSNLPSGTPPANHSTFNDDFRNWTNATIDCPTCGNDLSDGSANMLHKVAYFLKNTDLRSDLVGNAPQTLNTYTISFGIDATTDAQAIAVLQKTAALGGGRFANASSGTELEQYLASAASEIVARAATFSNTSTATLQAGSAGGFFIPRFVPRQGQAWEGHLYRFKLFSEFAMGCDSTKATAAQPTISCGARTNPNMNGDQDGLGNAVCNGLFIVDSDCDPVVEGADGGLYKGVFDGSGNLTAGSTLAVPFWDAATVLASKSDASRTIYTVVDTNGDGKFTAADASAGMTRFEVANVATLAPLMDLSETWCRALYARTSITPPAVGAWAAADTQKCARQVIYYIRGYDVLDGNGNRCAGPENSTSCTGGEMRSGTKLGDIFHSTPVTVSPPAPEFLCDLGAEPQCLPTLHSSKALTKVAQTPLDPPGTSGTPNAYELYRRTYATRPKVVLVGANDGMLHAFHAGASQPTLDHFGANTYDEGTGDELWAFIPPDLLPKLKLALDRHTYFVDGTAAVRDIWVDTSGDGQKQQGEFHTLAVISEQVGGTHLTGLDVTNPTAPVFRWSFPDDCTLDGTMKAQSWTSFVPQRPPIGPVKIAGTEPTGRGFQERWIVAINGGYDASLAKGRGIWMVDAWDGSRIWSFTNEDLKTTTANESASMGPVPGTVAMVDIGNANQPVQDFDGFFDTAVWGDMNGQLFLARMQENGAYDAGQQKVTNWTAGRLFEEQKTSGTPTATGRHPFFELPALVWDANFGALRTYAGTGNRSRILQSTAECTPDNLLGCCEGGCTNAEVTVATSYGACTVTSHYRCNAGSLIFDRTGTSGSCSGTIACGPLSSTTTMARNCGGVAYPTLTATLGCDATGLCGTRTEIGAGNAVSTANLSALTSHNRFYGLWAYSAGSRGFEAGARAYDQGRFTDVSSTGCAGPGGTCQVVDVSASASISFDPATGMQAPLCTGCAATASDPGWMIQYAPTDEKSTTMADVSGGGCVLWNTFRPNGSGASAGSPCNTTSGTATAITYMSDVVTGTPSAARSGVSACGFASTNTVARSRSRTTGAPPANPITLVQVSPTGSVMAGPQQVEPGSGGAGSGTSNQADTPLKQGYWLEVPRDMHACRHSANPSACQ